VITQNIDGYHARAGNENVLEVHGSIHQVRCHHRCGFAADWPREAVEPFACPACGAPVRPDLVMFGETLDEAVFATAERSQPRRPTSSSASAPRSPCNRPLACRYGRKAAGALVVEVNPHPTPLSDAADHSIRSGASQFFSCTVHSPRSGEPLMRALSRQRAGGE
jgi:NAD-dependent deacetylase